MVKAFVALLLLAAPAAFAAPKPPAPGTAPAQPAKILPAAPNPAFGTDATAETRGAGTEPLLAENTGGPSESSQALETLHVPQLPAAKSTRILGVEAMPSRRSWILLSIADHSAAAFDAYSTRYAVSRGAVEADPMMRPFANSDGIYAVIQIVPVALDFMARRMQRSDSTLLRRTWWLPQSASTGLFLFSGAHNLTAR